MVAWLIVNPTAFPPVDNPTNWASRGIYGERMWFKDRVPLTAEHRRIQRALAGVGLAGFVLLTWGLVALEGWPTIFGASLIVIVQLWRIDRYTRLYDSVAQ